MRSSVAERPITGEIDLSPSEGSLSWLGGIMIDGSAEEDSANPNKLSMFSELGRVAVGEVKTIERTDGFYNPAAWMDDDDITYLLGRYVEMIPDQQSPDEDTSSEMPVIGGGPDTTGLIKLMALGRDGQIVDELTRVCLLYTSNICLSILAREGWLSSNCRTNLAGVQVELN